MNSNPDAEARQIAVPESNTVSNAQAEVYGAINPIPNNKRDSLSTILVDFSANNNRPSSSHIASFKDTFNPPVQQALQQNTDKYLPPVTVSTTKLAEAAASDLKNQLQQEFTQQLTEELSAILLADLTAGPAGLEDFDLGLYNEINSWRKEHGLSELEYDPDLRDMAIANNQAMRNRGQLGHWAYGGYEVAGWNYGTPQATMVGWLTSPDHLAIISNPNLRKMGPAGDPTWQTVHFS